MTQLAKSIIHNQTYKLAKRYYPQLLSSNDEGRRRALSKTYALLSVMLLTDVDEEVAADAVVDGTAGEAVALDGPLPQEAQLLLGHGHVSLVGQLKDSTALVVVPGPALEEDQRPGVGIFHDTS